MQAKDIKVLKIMGVLLAVVLTVSAVAVLAQGPPPGPMGRGQGQGLGPGQGMGPGPGQGMGRGRGQGMGRGMGPGMGPGRGMLLRGLRALNLTDAQKQSIKAITEQHKPEVKAIADVAIPARKALREAVTADTFDAAAIRAAAAKVAAAEADGAVLRARIHSEVWAVLTPEQQQKARQMRELAKNRLGMRLNQLRQRAGRMLNETLHSLL